MPRMPLLLKVSKQMGANLWGVKMRVVMTWRENFPPIKFICFCIVYFFLFNYKHVIKQIQTKQKAWLYFNRAHLGMGNNLSIVFLR